MPLAPAPTVSKQVTLLPNCPVKATLPGRVEGGAAGPQGSQESAEGDPERRARCFHPGGVDGHLRQGALEACMYSHLSVLAVHGGVS